MKTIGLIGGMSWESTLEYYRIINQRVKEKLGGFHSAEIVLRSIDFAEIEDMQNRGDWDAAAARLARAAVDLEKAGADFALLCTNTMHKVFDAIQAGVGIPLLHIADVTGREIRARGLTRVGLLGTKFTMEQDFYKGKLERDYGIGVLIPDGGERETIHRVIYSELCMGEVKASSRDTFGEIIRRLEHEGAQGIVLGCTEIPLLVQQKDFRIPLFDTTALHARAAADAALEGTRLLASP
jgi:aspartate racemase